MQSLEALPHTSLIGIDLKQSLEATTGTRPSRSCAGWRFELKTTLAPAS